MENVILKTGDVKVCANELKHLLEMFSSSVLDNNENKEFFDFFYKKYMLLNSLREKEKSDFDMYNTIKKKGNEFTDTNTITEYENMLSLSYDNYKNSRENRIILQEEVQSEKEKKYYWLI